MSSYPNVIFGSDFEAYRITTSRRFPFGTALITQDGRQYRYGLFGGVTIAAGRVVQAALPDANLDDVVFATAGVVGDRALSLTLNSGTNLTANQLADGYVVVQDDTGEGLIYQIDSHLAISASTTGTINIKPPGLRVATITATTVLLVKHFMDSVLIQASPPTALPVGATATTSTTAYYGWIQTRGPASVLTDATVVIGATVACSDQTDGSVMAVAAGTTPVVGWVMEVAVTTEESCIFLRCD